MGHPLAAPSLINGVQVWRAGGYPPQTDRPGSIHLLARGRQRELLIVTEGVPGPAFAQKCNLNYHSPV